MMKNVFMLVIMVAAIVAVTGNMAAMAAADGGAGVKYPGASGENLILDKTGPTGAQENEAGSQVLVLSGLTNPVSFLAEGKGFEPSTGWTKRLRRGGGSG